jgi:Ser/Thr protein kinase RdoA (MazF antagonist)
LRRLSAFGGGRLSGELSAIADRIEGDAQARDIAAAEDGDPATRMDFSTNLTPDGALRLRRFYWSAQRRAGGKFLARTFAFHSKTGDGGSWFDFPADPDLPGAAAFSAGLNSWRVLRYVPLRRLAVLRPAAEGGPVILKFKRVDRISDAARILGAVNLAARPIASFRTPQLLSAEVQRGVMGLELMPGTSIAGPIRRGEVSVRQTAAVLAEMAAMDVAGLPAVTPGDTARAARQAADWVGLMLPMAAPALSAAAATLARAAPDGADIGFCHGDMGADQVLADGVAPWTILDFDRAHFGSACCDAASFMVKLQRDEGVIIAAEEMVEAYGAAGRRRIGRKALHWHLACAELNHLQQLFKKGRATEELALLALGRIQSACRECLP